MLVDQHWITVRVNGHEASWSGGGLVGLGGKRDARRFQLALQVAHVGEALDFLRIAVPAGIEGQDVLLRTSRRTLWTPRDP